MIFDHFQHRRELCSYWNTYLLLIQICLLCTLLPKLPPTDTECTECACTECLIHHHSILHSISSNQYIQFTVNKTSHWSHTHGSHWFHHVCNHPEVTDQKEWWNGFLKTQLQCPLGGNTLQGRSVDSPWGYTCAKSAFNIWCCFFRSHDSWAQKSRGECGSGAHSLLPLVIYWYNFRFLFLWLYALLVSGLSPNGKKNTSTRRLNNDFIELEVTTATQQL